MVASCSHTPATSSLPHMPALSFPVLLGKWWAPGIPQPSPSSRAQNAPSLASNAAGENAMHVSGDPGYIEPSAFLSFLLGQSYKPVGSSCHGLALWEWKRHFFPTGDSMQRPRMRYREKAMAPHSSTLAWKIPWTEEPVRLQSMGLLRVGHV